MVTPRRIAALAVSAYLFLGVSQRPVSAQEVEKGAFGLGIILGEPLGVSAKLYLSDATAVDAAVGSAFIGGGIHVHADFLWHPWLLEEREMFVLPAYIGGGVRILDHNRGRGESDFHLGARGVAGLLFDFKEIPLDVFIEVAIVPQYVFSDDDEHSGVGVDVNFGAGVRYYF